MDIIKKIFSILSSLPAFANLFKKASQTGKIDPVETLNALSSLSPGTKKISDTALNVANSGGNIADVAQALTNVGKINVMGQELDTRTLVPDLKKAGGVCSVMANILESMQNQNPEDIVNFGNAASSISNWKDIINQ